MKKEILTGLLIFALVISFIVTAYEIRERVRFAQTVQNLTKYNKELWPEAEKIGYQKAVIDCYYGVSLYQVAEDSITGKRYLMHKESEWSGNATAVEKISP